jgi:protein-S-isoprenylcysteine O-methyltransferase Ste14
MISSVAIIVGYAILYGVVHSWLASQRMKHWTRRTFGPTTDRWYRLAYNLIGGVTLLPLLPMLVWLPDRTLYTLTLPWLWLALLGQLAAAAGIVYGLWLTNIWHFLGLCQLLEMPDDDRLNCRPPLVIFGLYRLVRHPLYFWGLVFIWLTPQMTVNRLALFAVFSLYLYIGTFFEEQRLVAEFGDAYRAYQRQVPRLIPAPWAVSTSLAQPGDDASDK